ncbi:hypothetical protein B0H13DRAFT_2068642 [Mycena leptocephala]|nr:hypothetical protein B0H13DRAFT_2068642 [Mycena leptocephala]
MHLPLAFLLYLLPLLSAAPTSTTASASVDVDDASTLPHSSSADGSVSRTPLESQSGSMSRQSTHTTAPAHAITHKPTVGPSKHNVPPITHPTTNGQITLRPGSPTRSPGPAPSHFHPHPPPHHQSTSSLVFEILGAIAGILFFLSVLRCIYSYNRTPSHDRITAILHRHQLQREMEELERNPPLRRASLVEPPPPYIAPPPSYPADEHTPLSPRQSLSYGEETRLQLSPPLRPNG